MTTLLYTVVAGEVTELVSAPSDLDKLLHQYKGKPFLAALILTYLSQFDDLQEAIDQVRDERWVNTAQGAQLDVLGRIAGQDRNGMIDAVYKLWIRARMLLNRSNGKPPEVYAIMDLVTEQVATLQLIPEYPAAFVLLRDDQSTQDGDTLAGILAESAPAGVRTIFEYTENAPSNTMTFSVGSDLEASALLGLGGEDTDSTGGFWAWASHEPLTETA